MVEAKRTGASRVADVPADILKGLNSGQIEAATLVENLATDFSQLLSHTLPDVAATVEIDATVGVTKRMTAVAAAIIRQSGDSNVLFLSGHQSDLVRGWGAYVIGALPEIPLADRLIQMRAFADDPHFGVREWSWLALRPHVVKNPHEAIGLLRHWVVDPSANVRRFAIEATRPRGVWSAHIAALKEEPKIARPLLDGVASDSSRYVQDSVANWLNDAWKTNPQWVEDYCATITARHKSDETFYIVKRALRNKK